MHEKCAVARVVGLFFLPGHRSKAPLLWTPTMTLLLSISTREQAIEYLRGAGYDAFPRDWVMGETIGVGAGRTEENLITAFRHLIYLCPSDEGLSNPRPAQLLSRSMTTCGLVPLVQRPPQRLDLIEAGK